MQKSYLRVAISYQLEWIGTDIPFYLSNRNVHSYLVISWSKENYLY